MGAGPAHERAARGNQAFTAANRLFVERRRGEVPPHPRRLDAFTLEGTGAVGVQAHFDVPNTRRTSNMTRHRIVAADCSQVNKLAHAAVNCKRAKAQTVILS